MSGHSFGRYPSEKQARERERSGFGMRMSGQGTKVDDLPAAGADQDARLAELIHERLELGASSLEESKAERLSLKMARLAAELLSESELQNLTSSFSLLGRATKESEDGWQQASGTPSVAPTTGNSVPSYPTPPSTGHMDWSPAGRFGTGGTDSAHEAGPSSDRATVVPPHHTQVPPRTAARFPGKGEAGDNYATSDRNSQFRFHASAGATAPSESESTHKRPSPRKASGRRHRPRAQIATAAAAPAQASNARPPAKAPAVATAPDFSKQASAATAADSAAPAKARAAAAAPNFFKQASAGETSGTAAPLNGTRSDTSRAANVIREALASEPPNGGTGASANGWMAGSSSGQPASQPKSAFTFCAAAPSGPTAPFPQMFNASLPAEGPTKPNAPQQKANLTDRTHPGVSASVLPVFSAGSGASTSAAAKSTAPAAPPAVPINPFSPDAALPRDAARSAGATSGASQTDVPAATAAAPEPAVPFTFSNPFTFGKPAAAEAASNAAAASARPAAPSVFGKSSQDDSQHGASKPAATAGPDACGFGGFCPSPTAKPPPAAPNPFGSPMTPLARAGFGRPAEQRPANVNLFGAAAAGTAAPAGGPETPVFVGAPRGPVAGATPPSTDGPSTAGSPFGGSADAEAWFRAPQANGSASRRRARAMRMRRDNIHATSHTPAAGAAAAAASAAGARAPPAPLFAAGPPPPPPPQQAHGSDTSDSDAEHGAASSASDNSTGAFARPPGAAGLAGQPAAGPAGPGAGHETPREWAAGGAHFSPMSTGRPQAAPLASQTPPRQRYTARRPTDAHPDVRGMAPCGHQAKENHIPPNVQPSGAAPAGSADAAAAKLSAADKLRRQGNQKFKESQWSEAVVDYSCSIDVLHSLGERAPPEQMALLLGNRAAARMMQARVREALADCMHALKVQPWFTRAIERAAKCHLRLGDFAAADALLSAAQARPQVPAADARALAQRLAEVRQACAELDAVWAAVAAAESADDVAAAERDAKRLLERMCEAFDVNLLHAAALLRAGRWRQAEAAALAAGSAVAGAEAPRAKLQAWWLQCETLYAEGELEKCVARLECGLGDLEALERSEPADAVALERGLAGGAAGRRVPLPPAAHVRERVADLRQVLQGRSAGNAAFTDKRYEEAARLYTLALGERRVAAPAFWARLYSNRAAAYQAQEKWVDALADCGRARALDPSFHKVLSRLASLHEAVRRPGAALSFLQALQACPGGTAAGGGQAAMRQRIADLRVSETRGGTPHHFKLLHLPLTATAADVRSAYRKLALGNHPDKARTGCAYAPSLSGPPLAVRDTGLHDRVVAAADDLFKVINEACTVLSDNVKRDKCARELGGGGGPAPRYDSWGFTYEEAGFDFHPPRRPHPFGRRTQGYDDFW